MTVPTLPLDLNQPGIIGTRSVRALQLVRIGRHPSTVMLVPAQGLWVVSGRGPQSGSNGAGKTVLLAALSLLHGDAQWNGGNGTGPNAARLLFDHDRARVADAAYSNASHGYIVGVFFPDAEAKDPVSVWMRIERHSAPYVQVRYELGVRLAVGDSEVQRASDADDLWNSLRPNGTLTVTEYPSRLYGDAPRCIASIRARGSEENQDRGLLALGHRPFRPTDLASQVIMLAGKQNAVDTERDLRNELDANEAALVSKKKAYEEQFRREDRELRDIERRKQARSLCAGAAQAWDTYLTILHLAARDQAQELEAAVRDLETEIGRKNTAIAAKQAELDGLPSRADLLRLRNEAWKRQDTAIRGKDNLVAEEARNSQRKEDLEAQISELRPRAALAVGVTVEAADASLTAARDALEKANRDYDKAERDLEEAKDFLEELTVGTGGPAGPALTALRAEGIDAASILDLITLPAADRLAWEARLSPYARTIIVSRDDVTRSRGILAAHPGVPLILCDGSAFALEKTAPGDDGLLGELLRRLGDRMPETRYGWVEDRELRLDIQGGYNPPLADRQSAIAAARETVDNLREKLGGQLTQHVSAESAVTRAENLLAAARASVEITGKQSELDRLLSQALELTEKIVNARENEEESRAAFATADGDFNSVDQRRTQMNAEMEVLKHGSAASGAAPGLAKLLEDAADARERGRKKREEVESLRQISGISDLDAAEAMLAEKEIAVDHAAISNHFHDARKQLRQAVERILDISAAVGREQTTPDDGQMRATGYEAYHLQLNDELRELHKWCDSQPPAEGSARAYEAVERPLRSWLDWNGADDESREVGIHESRARERAEIEAAEHETEESRKWFEGRQGIQIDILKTMFRRTENTLRELLSEVRQDPVALHPRYTDVGNASHALRWELSPQWLPPGHRPVDYSNPPNTAELIILHLLLATSALVASTAPRGRMLILDESGNNLDGPNLTRVSRVMRQVSEKYGLTVVLACQDLYTDLVAEHSAGMIQLVRSSPKDALNAPPVIIQDEEDRGIAEMLMPCLRMGRPEALAPDPV